MKTILIILCLIPTLALAETKLNFKDKTTMCGAYELKGNQYCKSMSGGEMCFDKAEIVSIAKVDDCTAVEPGEANTASLKANQQVYKVYKGAPAQDCSGWLNGICGSSSTFEVLPDKQLTREQQRGLNSPFIGHDGY